jgi:putative ABC transport system permease protein
MEALDRKLLRDFIRLWPQFLAIALVLAAGVAILLMSFGMSRALDETRATYYERNRFADVFADARQVPLSLLPAVRAIEGVAAVDARVTTHATLDIPGKAGTTVAYFASLPEVGEPILNVPLLRRGRMPDPRSTDEVLLNAPFAAANELWPGDGFTANIGGAMRQLTVAGWALSPEFIYTIGPGSLMPDNEDYGIIWMPERPLAGLLDRTGAFDNLAIQLRPGVAPEPVIDEVDRLLAPYGSWGAIPRADQTSNAFIDSEIAQLRALTFILPPIFLGVTVFLVNMVIGRIVALERAEIGLLKALGYGKGAVAMHYLLLSGLVAFVGVGIGWIAGSWLSFGLARLYTQFFDFPYLIYNVSWGSYAASAVIGIAAAGGGAVLAALRAARLSPATAMQPPAPPRYKRTWFDRALSALALSQPSMMILRSLIRWPLRAAISVLGLALAVSILVASNFFPDSLDEIMDAAFYQSNRQDAVLFFNDALPAGVIEEVRRLPGVMQAEGQQYLTAILRNGHREKRTVVEARAPGADLSRVVDATGRSVDPEPGGIVLSERLAAQLRVAQGDLVEIEFLGNRQGRFEMPVSRLVTQYFGLGAYIQDGTANAMFQQMPQVSVVNVTLDAAHRADFEARLVDLPRLAGSAMMDENRRSFEDTIAENVVITTTIYTILGLLITVGVTYNGARIQLSERARELASLRILGFTKGEVGYILMGEIMLLALLAQPVGWLLGYLFARATTEGFESDLYAIPLVLKPATFANASLVVLVAALFSVGIVLRRLNRLDLVAVMKTRE